MNNADNLVDKYNNLILKALHNVKIVDLHVLEEVIVLYSWLHRVNQIVITSNIISYILSN